MLKSLLSATALAATASALTVNVASSGGNATSPFQYGIMFEDINNSGDGGIYAELVNNRAFQGSSIFPSSLQFWYPIGGAHIALKNLSSPLSDALPTSIQVQGGDEDTVGFWNEGESSETSIYVKLLTSLRFLGLPGVFLLELQWIILHSRQI
jgi:alpha-N-arabinofuranosidase